MLAQWQRNIPWALDHIWETSHEYLGLAVAFSLGSGGWVDRVRVRYADVYMIPNGSSDFSFGMTDLLVLMSQRAANKHTAG